MKPKKDPSIRFNINFNIDTLTYDLVISLEDGGVVSIMDNPTWKEFDGEIPQTSKLSIGHRQTGCLNVLMDDLWRLGIRPTNYEDTIESLKHMKHHLNDMRTLLFAKEKVLLPERKAE